MYTPTENTRLSSVCGLITENSDVNIFVYFLRVEGRTKMCSSSEGTERLEDRVLGKLKNGDLCMCVEK